MVATLFGHRSFGSEIDGRSGAPHYVRFQDIPAAIDIPLPGGDDEQEAVEVDLESLDDDPTELCTLLENERIPKNIWVTIALAYAKHRRIDLCISILTQAVDAFRSDEKLSLLTALCWLYLRKCRDAPRVQPEGTEIVTKETYLGLATSTLNDASRINPSFMPLFLARGVLCLLRASLIPLSRSAGDSRANSERTEVLRQALKSFDDAHRASGGSNLMAYMGKARVLYSLREYTKALELYQTVLARCPSLTDPDPRIGIGCCLWNLNHREHAKAAWERSLELNPSSPLANILMAIYYLQLSARYLTTDPKFVAIYKKAMTQYAQEAFKLSGGNQNALICSTFANYFLRIQSLPQVEKLARKAIETTDVNSIASDGWYLLAHREHYLNNLERAAEYYGKSDAARGDEQGHTSARFGLTQIKIQTGDYPNAKFRLEKLIQTSKSVEAMTLLGSLLAEEILSAGSQTDAEKDASRRKAIQLLEAVRLSWNATSKNITPDPSVLLTLARLYERAQPDKSLQCLQQVERLELEAAGAAEEVQCHPITPGEVRRLRKTLPPQLLSNIGCFLFQSNKIERATEYFEDALQVCKKLAEDDPIADLDGLLTTITFNLARSLEANKELDEARKAYEEVLDRHPQYLDGKIRLAFIKLQQEPTGAGPKAIQELFQAHPANLEVRALFGWYLSRSKKRTSNIAEDQEQRHYKHTLQQFNKHDKYALTGMGNIHLTVAREMRRDSEQDKERRHKMYQRAIEFFDKALLLDPRNVYAAQGVAIVLAEDKKDFASAIQLLSKVKDSISDYSVFINLGHAFADLRQFSRSIESYTAAISKDRTKDTQLLSCLGRVWLMKGRQEKDLGALKTSLDFSKQALAFQPDQVFFRFNVAFVQSQIAQQVYTMSETQRQSEDIREAALGLDEAIATFLEVAQAAHPPFPRNDIEQRASMGRNTTKKQLERALQAQEEYERRNRDKIERAREQREAAQRRRKEEKLKRDEEDALNLKAVEAEREVMRLHDVEMAQRRLNAEKLREEAEMTTDQETGVRRKRTRRKSGAASRQKVEHDSDRSDDDAGGKAGGDNDGRPTATKKKRVVKRPTKSRSESPPASEDDDHESAPRKQKKRRLEQRSNKKFKSTELVDDSDLDDDEEVALAAAKSREAGSSDREAGQEDGGPKAKPSRVVDDGSDTDTSGYTGDDEVLTPLGLLIGEDEDDLNVEIDQPSPCPVRTVPADDGSGED